MFQIKTIYFAIQKTPDSQECQQLHPEGVNEMVPMQKKPSNGSQLMTTPIVGNVHPLHFPNKENQVNILTVFCTTRLV